MCTSAPIAVANAVVSSPMVPGPQTRIRFPGPAWAAEAARQPLPPGSTRAPARSSIASGSRYRLDARTSTFSASAPGQSTMPTSRRSAQTCPRPAAHRGQCPQPSMVSPVTRAPSQPGSTPSPSADTTPHHSCPGRIGKPILPWAK